MRPRRPSMQSRSLLIYILIILLLFLNFFGALGIISCKLIKIVISNPVLCGDWSNSTFLLEINDEKFIPVTKQFAETLTPEKWCSRKVKDQCPEGDLHWKVYCMKILSADRQTEARPSFMPDPAELQVIVFGSVYKRLNSGCWHRSILIFGKRLTQRGSRLLPWQYLEPQKASGCLNCEFHLACP